MASAKAKPTTPPPAKDPPRAKPIKILPMEADTMRDPQKFAAHIFAQGTLILQELFNTLPDCPAAKKAEILADLYKTSLNFRPFITQQAPTDGSSDPATELLKLLTQTEEEEHNVHSE
jgi:hypothetical protein